MCRRDVGAGGFGAVVTCHAADWGEGVFEGREEASCVGVCCEDEVGCCEEAAWGGECLGIEGGGEVGDGCVHLDVQSVSPFLEHGGEELRDEFVGPEGCGGDAEGAFGSDDAGELLCVLFAYPRYVSRPRLALLARVLIPSVDILSL